MKITILTEATIIDGTGKDPVPNGSVIIEGDRIREICSGSVGPIPRGAVFI
jgi:hypothetical protein